MSATVTAGQIAVAGTDTSSQYPAPAPASSGQINNNLCKTSFHALYYKWQFGGFLAQVIHRHREEKVGQVGQNGLTLADKDVKILRGERE